MPAPNILVVVVDGLRASAFGAYGNTSFPTPALDQFAADSLLLDWCYAPSAELGRHLPRLVAFDPSGAMLRRSARQPLRCRACSRPTDIAPRSSPTTPP